MSYKILNIPLSDNEMQQLQQVAQQNFRRPKDQARYILLSGLGLTDEPVASTNQLTGAPNEESANILSAK